MLEHNKYNDRLVREHRELLKKARETADEKEKARILRLAEQKHLKGVLFQCVKTSDLLKEQQK